MSKNLGEVIRDLIEYREQYRLQGLMEKTAEIDAAISHLVKAQELIAEKAKEQFPSAIDVQTAFAEMGRSLGDLCKSSVIESTWSNRPYAKAIIEHVDDLEKILRGAVEEVARMAGEIAAEASKDVQDGAAMIARERKRQIEEEGCTLDGDLIHKKGELAQAAMAYIKADGRDEHCDHSYRLLTPAYDYWPWRSDYWKPKDRMSNLVRAGALIAAEIDRLKRVAQKKG